MKSNFPTVAISNVQVLRPQFETTQEDGFEWLAAAHAVAEKLKTTQSNFDAKRFSETIKKLIMRFGCGPTRIAKRGHALPDFSHQNWDEMKIFRLLESANGLGMQARMNFYSQVVDDVFSKFYRKANDVTPPNDLVHVTCTGYVSPSGAQKLVENKHWNRQTTVTHAYHMGCYASIPALRMARGFLLARTQQNLPNPTVDIVHTELCTLHMNPSLHDPEQLVVQGLFADGFIKYTASTEMKSGERCFKILSLREEIVPDSQDAMWWVSADWGMQMGLSKDVPSMIAKQLRDFINSLFADAGLISLQECRDRKIYYAIHPGGPKIIDSVQEILEIDERNLSHSREVLLNCGNMSSATLPHIWDLFARDGSVDGNALVVSLAFGPGLTICGALFEL